MVESNRIQKINQLFQEELAEEIRKRIKSKYLGILASVTEVRTSSDLGIAKAYISIFPTEKQKEIIDWIESETPHYRNAIGQSVAKKMRKIPEIHFYLDQSIEKVQEIDDALSGKGDNPTL